MAVSRGDNPRSRAEGPCIPALPRRRGVVPLPSCFVRAAPRLPPRVAAGAPSPGLRGTPGAREETGPGGRTRGCPDDRQAVGVAPRRTTAKRGGVPDSIRSPSDPEGAAREELYTRSKELQRIRVRGAKAGVGRAGNPRAVARGKRECHRKDHRDVVQCWEHVRRRREVEVDAHVRASQTHESGNCRF